MSGLLHCGETAYVVMKNRFFTVAFGVLFVHQLIRFLWSLEIFATENATNNMHYSNEEDQGSLPDAPFYKRDFPLSQFAGVSSQDEREQRKADLEAECATSSRPKSIRGLNAREKSVLLKHIVVSDKYKFLYCYVPKVACSNWKRVVMVLEGISDDFVKDHPHGLKYLSDYSNAEIEKRLRTYFKFAFVRNPLERLLSAYRNKFGEIEDVMRSYGVKIKKTYGSYVEEEYEGKIPGDDVSFEEFIRYLIDTKSVEYMNEHWAPMHTLCQPCLVNYDFIGSYDNLFEDSEAILQAVSAPQSLHFPTRQSFYSPTSYATTAYYYSTVNATYLEKLTKKYSSDFTLFSYPFPKNKMSDNIYET